MGSDGLYLSDCTTCTVNVCYALIVPCSYNSTAHVFCKSHLTRAVVTSLRNAGPMALLLNIKLGYVQWH